MCLILDFGSHYLQLISTALLKSDSHKGKNKKENFVVEYYYNNKAFFILLVVGAEVAAVMLIIMKRSEFFQTSQVAKAVTAFMVCCLSTKMFINYFQWVGAHQRLKEYDNNFGKIDEIQVEKKDKTTKNRGKGKFYN